MANQLVATYLSVGGTDLSGFITSCEAPEMVEQHDDTVMTDTGKSNRPGLSDAMITVEGVQDFSAGGPDATISAVKGSTSIAMEWRPTGSAVSSTNPKRTATFVLESYTPISGQRGALAMFKATFKPGGSAPAVVRATS